jgi:glutathione S-transferase
MLELWHEWNSVQSFRVRAVLSEKRVSWTGHVVELLRFEQLRPEYLALNPNGVVPTLRHEGVVLTESTVIGEYLDESFPEPSLLPSDAVGRARARIWCKRFDEVWHPAIRQASFELLYRPLLGALPADELAARLESHPQPIRAQRFRQAASGGPDMRQVEAAIESFVAAAQLIDAALADAEWLSGGQFGLADIALAPFVDRADDLGVSRIWTAYPQARMWASRLRNRPSIIAACPPADRRLSPPAGTMRVAVETLVSARLAQFH